ncbi:DedA family protein [Dinghuibacter silviterrae]|uniref:Membrane protein DedA with SNARE-associated domain n=1 Tax=Dinghuibacter silviterrae TaxID=1539049 RepID=A0A4R8DNF7_9BACT|nr:DedA family protein [Dinghuibacter silviterrae]TDW99245.1 membrane protein DedA with SNARE-associated domain [Dinghuibacter silviterrae]
MEHIVYLLSHYKYLLLFPLAIVEGPILAVIAGFLCTTGVLNPLFVFPIIVCGDVIGDSLCYTLGRWGVPKPIRRLALLLGVKKENVDRVRTFFDTHPIKTIALSKITLGIGVAGIYLAGNTKVPYPKFIRICLATSALQYLVYLTIGFVFGGAYREINRYLNDAASLIIVVALAIVVLLLIRRKLRKA